MSSGEAIISDTPRTVITRVERHIHISVGVRHHQTSLVSMDVKCVKYTGK